MEVIVGAEISFDAAKRLYPCPPGPDRVDVRVRAEVSFDPATRLYTYSYTVFNAAQSDQEVERFEIHAAHATGIGTPAGWIGVNAVPGVVMWGAVDVDPAVAEDVTGDASVSPSIANIKPGASLTGFSVQSIDPPGDVSYEAYGWAPVAFEGSDDEWDDYSADIIETCPLHGRKGSTQGPSARAPY